jgi:hypothetical protein
MASLKQLEPSVDRALRELLLQLGKLGDVPIDMGLWAQLFAFGDSFRVLIIHHGADFCRCDW